MSILDHSGAVRFSMGVTIRVGHLLAERKIRTAKPATGCKATHAPPCIYFRGDSVYRVYRGAR